MKNSCQVCAHWDGHRCRHSPPTIVAVLRPDGTAHPWSGWPLTYADDWCSECKRKEA